MIEIGGHDRGCGRPEFGASGKGIGLERQFSPFWTDDLIFVGGTGLHSGGEDLPDTDIARGA
jgi:hypothetical protein